MDKCYL